MLPLHWFALIIAPLVFLWIADIVDFLLLVFQQKKMTLLTVQSALVAGPVLLLRLALLHKRPRHQRLLPLLPLVVLSPIVHFRNPASSHTPHLHCF